MSVKPKAKEKKGIQGFCNRRSSEDLCVTTVTSLAQSIKVCNKLEGPSEKVKPKYTVVSGKGREDYDLLQLDKVPLIKGYRTERIKR